MHKYDTRDEREHETVRSVLAGLPPDHAARRAYADGATTIELSHLVGEATLVERLKVAYLEGQGRTMDRCRSFRP